MEWRLSTERLDSRRELEERVRSLDESTLALGLGVEAPREFVLITASADGQLDFTIALMSNGFGLHARWLIASNLLLVGHDFAVSCIDLESRLIVSETHLQTLFHDFLPLEWAEGRVVLCETALVAVRFDGSVAWREDTDLISSCEVDGATVELRFESAPSVRITVENGNRITSRVG